MTKWKQKRMLAYFLTLTTVWVIVFAVLHPLGSKPAGLRYFGIDYSKEKIELKKGVVITQQYKGIKDGLNQLEIHIRNKGADSVDGLEVSIIGENNEEISHLDGKEIEWLPDTRRQLIRVPINVKMNHSGYTVRIENKGEDLPAFILLHEGLLNDESEVQVNGEKIEDRAILCIGHYQNHALETIFLSGWIMLVLISYIGLFLLGKPIEKWFLYIGTTVGMLWLVFNPFPHALDEGTHFFRAVAISEGSLLNTIEDEEIGARITDSYETLITYNFTPYSWYLNGELYASHLSGNRSFQRNPYAATYNPLLHMFPAAGIYVMTIIHAPLFMVILTSRFVYFLMYILFCYIGIRSARYYKTILCGVSLIPFSLALGASCTQDSLITSGAICFLGCFLGLYFSGNNKLRMKDFFWVICMSVIIAAPKYLIYVPLLLLLFLIPKNRFEPRHRIIIFLTIAGICLLSAAVQIYLLKAFPYVEDRNEAVSVAGQIKFVLTHIEFSVRNLGSYMVEHFVSHVIEDTVFWVGGGTRFGSIRTIAGVLILIIAVTSKDGYYWSNKREKRIFSAAGVLIGVLISGLVIAALYAGFTPVGSWSVQGVQSRYFYPVLPILYIFLSMASGIRGQEKQADRAAFGLMVINLLSFGYGCLAFT